MNFRVIHLAAALAAVCLAIAAGTAGAITPATDSLLAQASNDNPTTTAPATPATPPATSAPSPSSATPGSAASSPSSAAGNGKNASADAEARKVFDELDTNHDGTLSFDEFKRATIRPK